MADAFTTPAQATDFIAAALPKATLDNPKYLTKADGTLSQWLTENIRFATGAAGAVTAAMQERFTQSKDGKTTVGTHAATFSLADVTISAFSSPADVTPQSEAALGILFTCNKPGCVAAKWGDAASRADKTDIYIQDAPTRARLLAAFRRLQTP